MAPKNAPAETPAIDLSALATPEDETPQAAPVTVPDEIKQFVDDAHAKWKDAPKVWRRVKLGSEEAVNDVAKLASRYAKSTGRTFRRDLKVPATHLRYKVQDAVRKHSANDGES